MEAFYCVLVDDRLRMELVAHQISTSHLSTVINSTELDQPHEPDLTTNDPTTYLASWNKNVPGLQKQMTGGRLVGPSTYYANFDYLQRFLEKAKPTPDYLSWHEYTCDASWEASICLSHIENWTTHIPKIRSIMNETLGKTLPIIRSRVELHART